MGQNQSRVESSGLLSSKPIGQQMAEGATNSLIKSAFTPPSATRGGRKQPRMSARKNRRRRRATRRA